MDLVSSPSSEKNPFSDFKYFSQIFDSTHNKINRVFYGESFDPKNPRILNEIYRGVKDTFLSYKGIHDFLSYSDEDQLGVTIPDF